MFSSEILKKAKENGLNTAIETCGLTSAERIREISEYTDLFLFDYKETNSELHKKFTGAENDIILENLSVINEMKKKIILRCPIIPGCNDRKEHFKGIAATANKFEYISHIELEPYHSLGESKYISLGLAEHAFALPSDEDKAAWLSAVRDVTGKEVKFA